MSESEFLHFSSRADGKSDIPGEWLDPGKVLDEADYAPWFKQDIPIVCECPCHKTIEQGGGVVSERDCIHCRIIG